MELLWTALLLGLAGSVHCAAMCGPLLLAVARARGNQNQTASTVAYHAGRISIYVLLGLVFGALGHTLALAGWQRGLSIFAGATMLLGLLFSSTFALKTPVAKFVVQLKSAFGPLLHRRTFAAQFTLGAINGLLPCGLVYAAAAGAAATGHTLWGAAHMAAFGIGTLPMLLGLGVVGRTLTFTPRWSRLVPVTVVAVALLLVLRGLGLGLPYLSPAPGPSCH